MPEAILALDRSGLESALAAWSEPSYRARQVWRWLHAQRVTSFAAMTNLPQNLRDNLERSFSLRSLVECGHQVAADGLTEKWRYDLGEKTAVTSARSGQRRGKSCIETVLIREKRLQRRTVCVSCAVGCPVGCLFCASGQGGSGKNLTPAQLLEQVYETENRCRESSSREPRGITNVVFMGMGEPLLNLDAVLQSARVLADPEGLNLSGRHITISTVGVTAGIRRLAAEKVNFRLAVSLHAPSQVGREKLIPAAGKWPLAELLEALREYSRQQRGRRITIEYCLIRNVNAAPKQAQALVKLLRGLPCKINLIPLNPTPGYEGEAPPPAQVRAFQTILERAGLTCTRREEKGRDIQAACGQLRGVQATPGGF